MARKARYFLPGQPLHVIQRGNNRTPVFFHENDYRQYRDWLTEAADEHGCAVHAYVLMTNHVHLLVTPDSADSLPRVMQSLGRRYVRYINWAHKRTGTLWEGRYRAAPVDSDEYFFSCCVYIEMNPVRAGMVDHPRKYRWSSYRAHAEGAIDPIATEPAIFRRLGQSRSGRQAHYRALFKQPLEKSFLDEVRAATNGGWAIGSDAFKRDIAKELKRRVEPLPRGRPIRAAGDKRHPTLL